MNQYTEVYWTASFQAIMNFIELRNEKTSQWEIQEYARSLQTQMYDVYPITTKIWSEGTQMKKPTGNNQKKEGVTFEHFEYIPEEWASTEVNDLHQSPYFHFSDMFSSKQCDEVIEIGDTLEKIDSTIEDKGKVDNNIRQSKIAWMYQILKYRMDIRMVVWVYAQYKFLEV